ncbi:hypothetical protein P3T76_011920 [Phytophthora citrophthora]|uniref:Phosphoribosyltransferase domain-containing protein n=1 Tax=Phytophthora citrophthora TaxID=4793 RepID=A0AAD9G8D9_9STRA|nr:hypothetical protein P3T76_011920 [Phytophthora citrophthora]
MPPIRQEHSHSEASKEFTPALSGLSAFANPRLLGTHSSRWSPYERRESVALPLVDFENEEAPSNRRRRTSPRRRLAASKARAREMENYETAFVSMLPVQFPLRPPSPNLTDSKNSRYLREMDRRSILSRLDRGEKQSALAKEFRVTRSAICNLNKHRELVLSSQHGDPLAKHPKKTRLKDESRSNRISLLLSEHPNIHVVASQSAERLFPLLLSRDTSDSAFRHYCDRLMTLVVEEVLTWTQSSSDAGDSTLSGVSIAPGGSPMLSIFQTLEPGLPTGKIQLNLPQVGSPVAEVIDLPSSVEPHNICLFYAFTDTVGSRQVAKSIRQLLDQGTVEELLCLVTLAVSAFTVGELQRAHPSLRIAAARIEHEEDTNEESSRLELLASRAAAIY